MPTVSFARYNSVLPVQPVRENSRQEYMKQSCQNVLKVDRKLNRRQYGVQTVCGDGVKSHALQHG